MAHPRLRRLDIFPVEIEGRSLFCFRDRTGIAPQARLLPRAGALLATLCDGTRGPEAIAFEALRRGLEVTVPQVARFVEQLDEALLLDSPRLERERASVTAEFQAAPLRAARNAGGAYAGDATELRRLMSSWQEEVAGDAAPPLPAALVAPHIDFHRGGRMYARAYRALPAAPADLLVIFGTDHDGGEQPFTLTRKSYDTPFGPVPTDVALVDALAARSAEPEALFAGELSHRHEHSIELQLVWLRHLYGEAVPSVLPVLCGSLHMAVRNRSLPTSDGRIAAFLDALRELTFYRRVIFIAAADLAHVGPRFGDGPMRAAEREVVERADCRALAAVVEGDAGGFFRAVAADDDRHRICGLAPIFHTLALAGRAGRLLGYDQCNADEAGTSFVSIAAVAL